MFLSKLRTTLERYSPHIPNFHTTLDYHLSHSELCPTLLQTFRLTVKDCYKAETYRHKKRIDPVRINPNMRLLELIFLNFLFFGSAFSVFLFHNFQYWLLLMLWRDDFCQLSAEVCVFMCCVFVLGSIHAR